MPSELAFFVASDAQATKLLAVFLNVEIGFFMSDTDEPPQRKGELIAEIQRRVAYLLASTEFSPEQKEAVARGFFRVLLEE